MKTGFTLNSHKQRPAGQCREKSKRDLVWTSILAVGLILFAHVPLTPAQSCAIGAGCTVQYKVSKAQHSKCQFPEFAEGGYPNWPRIRYYHNQTTYAYYNNTDTVAGTNGFDLEPSGGCGITDVGQAGPNNSHYIYTKNLTLHELGPGLFCDYTNDYSGSLSEYYQNEDSRREDWLNSCNGCFGWQSYYYLLNQDFQTPVPMFVSGGWTWGIGGYDFTTNVFTGGDSCGADCSNTCPSGDFYTFTNHTAIGVDLYGRELLVSVTPTLKSYTLNDPTNWATDTETYSESGTMTVELNTEYTDDELRASILGLMPTYPSDWYTPDGDNFDFSMMVAYSVIDGDHVNAMCWTGGGAELQKMKYRFAVPGSQTNTQYVITWNLITYDLTTGQLDTEQHQVSVLGTGDPINPAYSDEQEAMPPYWDPSSEDCGGLVMTWVDNVNISSSSNSNGGPPGSGPFGYFKGSSSGCSSCGGNSSSGGLDMNSGGIAVQINMGRTTSNSWAGNLNIDSSTPSLSLATPARLLFATNIPYVNVILSSNQIRQVNAPQALADVITDNAFAYEIKYYLPSQVGTLVGGVYQLSGSPFVVWKAENPDASTNTFNRLRLTETRGSDVKVYDYTYATNTGNWKLDYPGGFREDETSVADTTNGYSVTIGGFSVPLRVRSVISTTRVPGGADQFKIKRVYQTFAWGEGLIEETVSPDSNPKTTTYQYYDYGIGGSANNRPLRLIVHPDGSWEYYVYYGDGSKEYAYSGVADEPAPVSGSPGANTHEFEYLYDPLAGTGDDGTQFTNSPRVIREYALGIEVARSYLIGLPGERHDIRSQNLAVWGVSADALVTITKYFTNGVNLNHVQSVENPDGTMSIYEYAWATDGSQTNTVYFGQPNSGKTAIVNGTKDVTILGPFGQMISHTVTDIISTIAISREIYGNYDSFSRPQRTTYLDGTTNQITYACCGVDTAADRDGVTTQYYYDVAKRQVASTRLNITTTNVLDAAGRTVKTIRIGSDNSQVILSQSAYNLAGDLVAETNALGGVTTYIQTTNATTGGSIRATIYPDGGTSTNFYYVDGSLKNTLGTAVHGVRYTNTMELDGGVYRSVAQEIKLDSAGNDTSEWTKTYTDGLGRNYKTLYSDSASSLSYYNNLGQLTNVIDPDGVSTLYQYNTNGEVAYTAVDMNQNGGIDFGGTDRITWTTNDVASDHSTNVRRSRTYVWDTLSVNSSSLISVAETSTDGLKSWQTQYRDASTAVNSQTQTAYGSSNRTVTVTAPDNSYTISVYSSGRLGTVTRYDSTGTQIGQTSYSYDAHGRQYQVTDARNGATSYSYNSADLLSSVTTPNPGSGGSAQTTTTYYNKMLQTTNVLQPDGTSMTNEYFLTGELKKTYGSRTYPVSYTYDYAGRMKTMTTWQNFAANSGTAVTTWNYDAHRGWLANKAYANTNGPGYTCTPAGRLSSRTWARGVVTTNLYDAAGGLYSVNYTDSTPGVTNTYDRLGRPISVFCNTMTDALSYNLANELLSESFSGGILNGLMVTNGYDSYLRRFAGGLSTQPSTLTQFGYDNASRLSSVTNGNNTASYTYLANSPLVSQIAYKQSGTARMTTTKQYDYLNRLTLISSSPSGTGVAPVSFSYSYNSANQRVQSALVDGSYWSYNYDSLGQVTSGKKYWADGTPVAGQQFDYAFDTIGNRNSTKTGGDETGANQRSANYTNNTLNQITGRDVPGYVDIKGISIATNTVTVAGLTAYRKGEYFRKELSVGNGSAALWTNLVVAATGQTSSTGNVFVAKAPETFTYDLDGNLTSDGRWTNTWDAENRLVSLSSLSNTPSGSKFKLDFAYDAGGRRIQKIVSTNNGSAYFPQITNKFVYDGWNLVAILNPASALVSSFVWGLDLSGSQQGAGGVGGLMEVVSYGVATNFVAYDGNGNVAALVKTTDGTVTANYEYGPFGEVIRATGLAAKANPFRFSTKYQDDESDLLYYGYRFYNQSQGRWLSRDPISEVGFGLMSSQIQGGLDESNGRDINNYLFAGNTPGQAFDYLGLSSVGIYDGADRGGSGLLCSLGICFTANGTDFKNFAVSRYDYQIDIRSCYGGETLWKANLISKLVALKKQGIVIDKIGFIDHGFPGHQEIGDDWLQSFFGVGSQEQKDWTKFYTDLGKKGFSSWWGDIVLEGCKVAEGHVGIVYLQYIANKTGHPVIGCSGVVGTTGFFVGSCFGNRVVEVPDNWDLPL